MAYTRKKRRASAAVMLAAVAVLVLAIVFVLVFGGEGGKGILGSIKDDLLGGDGADNDAKLGLLSESELPDATTPVQETNEVGTTKITFNGSDITIEGEGAIAEGSYLKIVKGGIYSLSGTLDDGRIAVRAQGQDVVLILDGVNVSCSSTSPLYINKAASVTLLLNGTKENVFTDGTSYDFVIEYGDAEKMEPDSCIFSKADLIIRGTGSLKVNANYKSGIISKDTLSIINTTVDVTAKNNGINGKDSLTIRNSTVRVEAGGDALRSTKDNDPSLGWAALSDSNLYLTAKDGDGVQVERGVTIDNCSISIKTADGAAEPTSESSLKGIKCVQGYAAVNSGTIIINSQDDAIHTAGDVTINGGKLSIATGDDAVHSDGRINISGGELLIPDCHEGLESTYIDISGGKVCITADDDGINASGGDEGDGHDMFASDGSTLSITGGYVYINANGDGIDSNGDVYMSGGTLIISGPTSPADGAIDYNGDFHFDGGLLFAAGSAGMAQAPDNMTKNVLSVTFDETLKAGTYISVSGGGKALVFRVEKDTQNVVIGSEELETGVEYTVSYGGKYSGDVIDCVAEGGKYSGGSEVAKITLTEGLNYYGRVGIGGSMGGNGIGDPGRFGGMGGEGHMNPFGDRPKSPRGDMPDPPA